ncbi:hypothetical protein OG874_01445 [Nocardia sp. NBC_00565]|uniref:hypothetical protein n=1 Tax=Nocardia sp. NBC_00565 TaxID=2975993 RepID=UPI002E800C95|nr:hypothetical protein [Nocardia sp. NBC_00565]WUC03910.1 hypothetical protein OG874_01445 [Nocardia sp. NBC_00565]
MHRIAGWWDGFELWVAGLPFIPQFIVVLVGMVPICFAIAYVLDRVLRVSLQLLGRDSDASAAHEDVVTPEQPLIPEPVPPVAMRETAQSGAR